MRTRYPFLERAGANRGFTMVEIAIALGVIVFALVAIIGVLPLGLNVQQENREETIINQEGAYFIEAIRGGQHGLDRLTNYVDSVTIAQLLPPGPTVIHTNSAAYRPAKSIGPNLFMDGSMTNGEAIIARLSTPKVNGFRTNQVTALVRAMNGSAAESSAKSKDLAFTYSMICDVVPFQYFAPEATNYTAYVRGSDDYNVRYQRWIESKELAANLYDVRLLLRWPVLPNGNLGTRRQVFHTLVSSQQRRQGAPGSPLMFQPQTYTYVRTNTP